MTKNVLKSAIFAGVLTALAGAAPTKAEVLITVNMSTQTMHVESASGVYDWKVSTARAGYVTPRGAYKPIRLERMHYSKKYDNAPMPNSIFFHGGYAIHATADIAHFGRPA